MKTDLENATRRGDENFDQLEREREESQKEIERLEKLASHYSDCFDTKCEELRERDKIIKALHSLLDAHKIDHSDLTDHGYAFDDEDEIEDEENE